jgi:outer membrane protein TolC
MYHSWPQLYRVRRLTSRVCLAGLPWLGLGCTQLGPVAQFLAPDPVPQVRAQKAEPETIPTPPRMLPPATITTDPIPVVEADHGPRQVPISLDTVLRMAGDGNGQIAVARERVFEACAQRNVARLNWIPDIYVGPAWYRHEGGIQAPDGNLIHASSGALFGGLEVNALMDLRQIAYEQVSAERRAWQQKTELSRTTSEQLLDTANTYVDLLAAKSGEAIVQELVKELEELYDWTKKRAEVEPPYQVIQKQIEAELAHRRYNLARLREQINAALNQLIYLLGLDPCVALVPLECRLAPFELIDHHMPVCDLVGQALTLGPGIRELEGLLAMTHRSLDQASGPGQYLPVMQIRMAEGIFGANPGSGLEFDNRWDLGLQARWNLSGLVGMNERRKVTQHQVQQVHLSYEDLRRRLAVGVQEAHGSACSGLDQMQNAETQIGFAAQGTDKAKERLKAQARGYSPAEVLLNLQGLASAKVNFVNAVRDFNKAQLRLLIYTGAALPESNCD